MSKPDDVKAREPWFAALRGQALAGSDMLDGETYALMDKGDVLLLIDIAEAAEACVKTWLAHGFTHNHIPDALSLSEALSRAAPVGEDAVSGTALLPMREPERGPE